MSVYESGARSRGICGLRAAAQRALIGLARSLAGALGGGIRQLRMMRILLRLALLILPAFSVACRVPSESRGIAIDSLNYRDANVVPSGILSARPSLDSFVVAWYSQQLSALREGRMAVGIPHGTQEAYRFLWLRSFHHPVAIRVYSSQTGAVAVTSEAAGAGGYAPGSVTRRDSVVLSDREWHALTVLIEREKFWDRPAVDTSRAGLDGAEWVVEGRWDTRYTLVSRWSPRDTDSTAFMRTLGLAFLRVGHVVVPPAEVY